MSGRACRTKPIHPSRFEARFQSIAPACNATLLPRRSRIPPAPTAPCPPPVKRHLFTAATTPLLSSPLLLAAKLSKPWNSSTSKKHLSLSLSLSTYMAPPRNPHINIPRLVACAAPLSLSLSLSTDYSASSCLLFPLFYHHPPPHSCSLHLHLHLAAAAASSSICY